MIHWIVSASNDGVIADNGLKRVKVRSVLHLKNIVGRYDAVSFSSTMDYPEEFVTNPEILKLIDELQTQYP